MNTKTIASWLPVRLTTEEKIEYGRKLAKAHQNYGIVEAEKKSANEGFKERLEALDSEASGLARIVRSGEVNREVDCQWRFLFETNTKELVRMDTGEIVETAAITADERQLMLQMEQETGVPQK